jgi:hypothetical protein
MPNEIDDKIAQCRRAVSAMATLQKKQDKDEFEYHFCAFIGAFGAARQYIQERLRPKLRSPKVEPEQQWLQALETNVDVASVIGMRNSDVHRAALRVSNQRVEMTLHEVSPSFSEVVTIEAFDKAGNVVARAGSVPESTPEPMAKPDNTMDFYYLLDPAKLPGDFMTADKGRLDGRIPGAKVALRKGDALPMKSAVRAHLGTNDLGGIAARALAALESEILTARSKTPPLSL